MDPSLSRVGDEAGARAEDCRRRIERLGRRAPFTAADAELAKAALERARARSAFAHVRSALVAEIGFVQQQVAAELSADRRHFWDALEDFADLALAPAGCAERVRAQAGSFSDLHATYVSLGGTCSRLELDAYVHGAVQLPRAERAVMEHALWELASF